MRYIEVCLGDFHNRNLVTEKENLARFVALARKQGKPLFRSLYEFDEEYPEYVRQNKTVAGFSGKAYIDRVLFDVDKQENQTDEQCLETARALVTKLTEQFLPVDHIRVLFSGRGYHIEIPDIFGFEPSENLPKIMASTIKDIFPHLDTIYDKQRLIRVGNTVNEKSGLYKIPLNTGELMTGSAEAIRALAKTPRLDFRFPAPTSELKKVVVNPVPAQPEPVAPVPDKPLVTYDVAPPSAIVTCAQKLYERGPVAGGKEGRHHTMLRLASVWRRAGLPQNAVITALMGWLNGSEPAISYDEVIGIVANVFHPTKPKEYGCNDELLSKYCSSECIHYKTKSYGPKAASAVQMEKDFVGFIRNDFSSTAINLADYYHMRHPFYCYPQEFIEFFGDTGLGKTAFVQDLITKANRFKVLVFTLEVGQHLYFRRLIQIAHKMTKQQVIEHYRNDTNHLSANIGHIHVVQTSPKLSNLKKFVADLRPHLVVIDTLDAVIVDNAKTGTDLTEKLAYGLKDIAMETNTIVLGVHHVSKHSIQDEEGGRKPLTVHSGKGSSSLEQKADKVIAIEGDRREYQEGDEELLYSTVPQPRVIRSLKARDEDPFILYAQYEPLYFTFKQLNRNQWLTLKQQSQEIQSQPGQTSPQQSQLNLT